MSKLIKFRKLFFASVAVFGLASCHIYNSASAPISIGELNLGMERQAVLAKYGQPFTFDVQVSANDTITVMSYKTPKAVKTCGFIVTTKLLFINDKLKTISQSDFFVPESVIYCDSIKVLTKEGVGYKK